MRRRKLDLNAAKSKAIVVENEDESYLQCDNKCGELESRMNLYIYIW